MVSLTFQAESLKSSQHKSLLKISLAEKVEIVCTDETGVFFGENR